jgi:Flp pilus assembly pilin Flp
MECRREPRTAGQSLAEYALLLALVVVMVIGGLILFGGAISSAFREVGDSIGEVSGATGRPQSTPAPVVQPPPPPVGPTPPPAPQAQPTPSPTAAPTPIATPSPTT